MRTRQQFEAQIIAAIERVGNGFEYRHIDTVPDPNNIVDENLFSGYAGAGASDALNRYVVVFLTGINYITTLGPATIGSITYTVAVHARDRETLFTEVDKIIPQLAMFSNVGIEVGTELFDSDSDQWALPIAVIGN